MSRKPKSRLAFLVGLALGLSYSGIAICLFIVQRAGLEKFLNSYENYFFAFSSIFAALLAISGISLQISHQEMSEKERLNRLLQARKSLLTHSFSNLYEISSSAMVKIWNKEDHAEIDWPAAKDELRFIAEVVEHDHTGDRKILLWMIVVFQLLESRSQALFLSFHREEETVDTMAPNEDSHREKAEKVKYINANSRCDEFITANGKETARSRRVVEWLIFISTVLDALEFSRGQKALTLRPISEKEVLLRRLKNIDEGAESRYIYQKVLSELNSIPNRPYLDDVLRMP